ncbi:hypothetical protein CFBP3840_P400021 (plasmid) [Pseudomonas syringae]|uniref:Uncharacterized protein n=2 Tax=Pseudomonas syringae group TaxID=136849 RepID=A0A2K4X422_PSESX|nr:hypothetical protein CFBP3840_P400021 [Pseudomonas syringae]SPD89708.1 hypothetical protein PSCFBP3800_P200072 [Pseudomonas syringae group genomosp. 3]
MTTPAYNNRNWHVVNPILLSEYLDAQEGSCIGISKCLCIKLTLWKEASCLHSDG